MAKDTKPTPTVFGSEEEACSAPLNGQLLYRLTLVGRLTGELTQFAIAASSPQAAKAAYVDHVGGVVERMTDKDKVAAMQRAMAKLQEKDVAQ